MPSNPILAAAENMLESSQAAGEAAKQAVRESQTVQAKVAKGTDVAITDIAAASRTVTLAEEKAKLQTQNAKRAAFTAMGGADRLIDLSGAYREASDTMVKEVGEVAELESKSLFQDGLFDYIGAQLRLDYGGEREQAAAAIQQEATLRAAITGTQQVTSSVAKTLNEVEELKSNATIDAIDQKMQAEAQMARLQNMAKLAESNAKATAALYTMNRQQLNDAMTITQEKRIAQQQKKAVAVADMKKATDDAIVRNYQLAQIKLGEVPLPAADILAAKTVGGEAGQKIQDYYAIGIKLQSAVVDGVPVSAGDDYVERFKYKPGSLAEDTRANRAFSGVRDTVEKQIGIKGAEAGLTPAQIEKKKAGITPEEMSALVTKTMDTYAESQADDIARGNMYEAEPMSLITQTETPPPAVVETTYYDKIIKPLAPTETNPQQLFELAASAVAQKELSINEAVEGVTTLFDFFKQHNNEFGNFANRGIPLQTSYNFKLKLGREKFLGLYDYPFAGAVRDTVDLSDPTAVRNAIATYLTNTKLEKSALDF